MKNWFENYIDLMIRTRWMSILAAVVLLFFSGGEVVGVLFAAANHEISFSIANNLEDLLLLSVAGLLVLALVFRIYALSNREEGRYFLQAASWVAVLVPLIAFFLIWEFATRPAPSAPCDPKVEGTCFRVYVLYRSPPLLMAMPIFIGGSIIRSLATFVFATLRGRKLLK